MSTRNVVKHALALAIFAASTPFAFSQSVPNGEMFDPEIAAKGITYSREACADLEKRETAVWVETGGTYYCLRYYAAGLRAGNNPIAALWLHGDIMGAHESPPNKRLKGLGVDAMIEQEQKLSKRFGVPFIFLGRPGSYASAGRHYTMRERKIEADIVTSGIDALKKKYGIEKWAFGGHSGGGVLVAEMLDHRSDIACAVISSAPGAFRDYLATYNSPDTNNPVVLDPIASIKTIPADSKRRIFVLADPRDTNVKFAVHQRYIDALKSQQVSVKFLALEKALEPDFHDMVDVAETTMGKCAAGEPDNAIIKVVSEMPSQKKRKTN